MPASPRDLLAFEKATVAQELLEMQGVPLTNDNVSRVIDAINRDPSIAYATPTGQQIAKESVQKKEFPGGEPGDAGAFVDDVAAAPQSQLDAIFAEIDQENGSAGTSTSAIDSISQGDSRFPNSPVPTGNAAAFNAPSAQDVLLPSGSPPEKPSNVPAFNPVTNLGLPPSGDIPVSGGDAGDDGSDFSGFLGPKASAAIAAAVLGSQGLADARMLNPRIHPVGEKPTALEGELVPQPRLTSPQASLPPPDPRRLPGPSGGGGGGSVNEVAAATRPPGRDTPFPIPEQPQQTSARGLVDALGTPSAGAAPQALLQAEPEKSIADLVVNNEGPISYGKSTFPQEDTDGRARHLDPEKYRKAIDKSAPAVTAPVAVDNSGDIKASKGQPANPQTISALKRLAAAASRDLYPGGEFGAVVEGDGSISIQNSEGIEINRIPANARGKARLIKSLLETAKEVPISPEQRDARKAELSKTTTSSPEEQAALDKKAKRDAKGGATRASNKAEGVSSASGFRKFVGMEPHPDGVHMVLSNKQTDQVLGLMNIETGELILPDGSPMPDRFQQRLVEASKANTQMGRAFGNALKSAR